MTAEAARDELVSLRSFDNSISGVRVTRELDRIAAAGEWQQVLA